MTSDDDALKRGFRDARYDPDDRLDELSAWEAFGYSGTIDWDELLQSRRILITASAGVGKTYECKREQERLWKAGEPAFLLELAELARTSVDDLLAPEHQDRLEAWHRAQSDVATFFLDSCDELKLTQGSFRTALTRLANRLKGQLGRVGLVITTRPISFDERTFVSCFRSPRTRSSGRPSHSPTSRPVGTGKSRGSRHPIGVRSCSPRCRTSRSRPSFVSRAWRTRTLSWQTCGGATPCISHVVLRICSA